MPRFAADSQEQQTRPAELASRQKYDAHETKGLLS